MADVASQFHTDKSLQTSSPTLLHYFNSHFPQKNSWEEFHFRQKLGSLVMPLLQGTQSTLESWRRLPGLIKNTGKNGAVMQQESRWTRFSKQSFCVTHKSGIFFNLFGALHGMQSSKGLELVDACTLVTLKSGAKFIMHVNQGLLDLNPLQMESLLQPYQARANGIIVDDVCKRHKGVDSQPGTQCIYVDGHELPIHFDGLKQFLCISLPTDADVLRYPSVVLTSPEPYEPQQRRYSCHVVPTQVNIEQWQKRLGYPTFDVTRKTLESTTQFVNSVEAETREYMRDHQAS